MNGDVSLISTEIPAWLKDIEIIGSFDCAYNDLATLKNCPYKIGGSFKCEYNKLTSLEGCPKYIEEDFDCRYNLVELKLPRYVKLGGNFNN